MDDSAARQFYIMRHGETTDNALRMISGGGSDPHLTRRGFMQVEMASLHFLSLRPEPDVIIASGMQRARMTAHSLRGAAPMIIDPRLNERHLGEFDGRITEDEQKQRGPLTGEESAEAHGTRVMAAIQHGLSRYRIPLFVCHAGSIRRVAENLQTRVDPKNAEIYLFSSGATGWSGRTA